jgi:hypothetical protein
VAAERPTVIAPPSTHIRDRQHGLSSVRQLLQRLRVRNINLPLTIGIASLAACVIILSVLVATSDTAASYYYSTPPVLDHYSSSPLPPPSSVWSFFEWLLGDPAYALLQEVQDLRLRLARTEAQLHRLSQLAASSRPRNAIFTLININPPLYCRLAFVLLRSLLLVQSRAAASAVVRLPFDFIIMIGSEENTDSLRTDRWCKALAALVNRDEKEDRSRRSSGKPGMEQRSAGTVRFLHVPPVALAAWHSIGSDNWRYSLHRMEMFRQLDYDRIVYVDADAVMVHSPARLFELGYDLAAVVDQWDGCHRREVMNGGLVVFRPSLYLFHQLMSSFYTQPSCISGNMQFSDQELINCVCGFGGPVRGSGSRDLTCSLLPSWTSTFPPETACPWFSLKDVLSVHYSAGTTKPWEWEDQECIAAASRSRLEVGEELFQRCHTDQLAFLSYWHCLDNRGSAWLSQVNFDCELVMWNNDTQRPLSAAKRGETE